jgi:DNA topoisomerase-1
MAKNLVIVESPAKAKTIEKYLGKDFQVLSSYGHIRDLPDKGMAIDIENGFLPQYEVSVDKQKLVSQLQNEAKKADLVWLATDEDREGEAISWHLFEVLNLDQERTRRITFNEITKTAIEKAVANPRQIDQDLVNAQQARRVLDRIVGFELSPILWRKIRPSLSAGRVQSVAVRLVADREREIQAFKAEEYFRVVGQFKGAGLAFKAELQEKPKNAKLVEQILTQLRTAIFAVTAKETKPFSKTPAAPFTTSTLQQEASRKLGFSPAQTMRVAQKLYEQGHITYMRTDATNLSKDALASAQEQILSKFGKHYHKTRTYATKSKGAQEAHEAIRPTQFAVENLPLEREEQKLYELIYKRTLASQMADATLERTKIRLETPAAPHIFVATGEVLKFDGFLKLYKESHDDENLEESEEGALPDVAIGDAVETLEIRAQQKFTQHPARYTEASLVRRLEELGIGRPSTYAPTLATIQKREYVLRQDLEGQAVTRLVYVLKNQNITQENKPETVGSEKKKLFPTDIGFLVNDFLVSHFANIVDFNFTAQVEGEFDQIADGKLPWQKMLAQFYGGFHKNVDDTLQNSDKVKKAHLLGIDEKTKKNIYVRLTRFGPAVQVGEADEEPTYVSLPKGRNMLDFTLADALHLLEQPRLPRNLGTFQGAEVVVSAGRFGPYIRHNSKFYSIKTKDGDDPMTITLARASEIIVRDSDPNKGVIKVFADDLKILEGRYGAYIKHGTDNIKIPAMYKKDPSVLTLQQVEEIVAQAPPQTQKAGARKAVAKKASAPVKAAKASTAKASKAKAVGKTTKKSAVSKKSKPS